MPPYAYWDTKADRDLLLAIIDEGALKSVHWPKVAQKMSEKGYTFTHEGCRYVIPFLTLQSLPSLASTLFSTPFHIPLTFHQHLRR